MTSSDTTDIIDMLIADWRRTRPATRPDAMHVIGRIIRLGRAWEEQVTHLLRPHGLSYSDFDVLATLYRTDARHEMSPTRLQRSVLLSSGAMTACLRRLETSRLIERRSVNDDRRRLTARLTEAGVAMVEALIDARFSLADAALSGLDAEEITSLTVLLRRLGAS